MPYPSNQSALELLLARLCRHTRLGEEERAAVLALSVTLVEVRARTDLVGVGDVVDHACLVSEGLVARFGQTDDARRQYVAIYVPGELVDLPAVMVPKSITTLTALTSSSIMRIPLRQLREIGVRYPVLAAAFWRDCVLDAALVAEWLVNVGRRDARARLAHLLCELALRYRAMDQSDGLTYELPMTQEQMADALGLTSVHVNRTLQTLRAEGIVTLTRSHVRILNWKALSAAGEFDAVYLQAAPLIAD